MEDGPVGCRCEERACPARIRTGRHRGTVEGRSRTARISSAQWGVMGIRGATQVGATHTHDGCISVLFGCIEQAAHPM